MDQALVLPESMAVASAAHVPTREEILALQTEMVRLPQSTAIRTDHYFVPGMYCRRLWRPAGTLIVGKIHKAPHFFLCAAGEIIAWSEAGMRRLYAGDVIESSPGTKRVTLAMTDAIGITIHKTDLTDLDEIERELIEPEEAARFGPGNKLKALLVESGVPPERIHIEGEGERS